MSERFVTLTWEFIRDKDTTMQEKLILAEIESLSSLDKGCIASNEHFAKLLGLKRQNASKLINSLKNKGYISVNIVNGSRNHDRRISVIKSITQCNKKYSEVSSKVLETKETIPVNTPVTNQEPSFNQSDEDAISSTNRFNFNEIKDAWNKTGLVKIKLLSDERKKLIRERTKDIHKAYPDTKSLPYTELWDEFIEHVASSSFLTGTNDRNWVATIDWLLKQGNIIKVMEGKYHD